jgi:RNA polymerase sigma-70 factor (ECF subfamily)
MDGLEEEALDSLIAQNAEGSADESPEEKELGEGETKKVLTECLERIDPDLREALWLIYAEDMSYAEAAEVMGVNKKRIDHLLTRGKQAMRKELKKEGVTDARE